MPKEDKGQMAIPEGTFTLGDLPDDPNEHVDDQDQNQNTEDDKFATIIEQQNKDREANERRWQQVFRGNRQPERETTPDPVNIDINGLPDPRVDTDGFFKGLAERMGKTIGQVRDQATNVATQAATQAAQREALFNNAWQTMQERYPDFKQYPELVETGVSRMLQEFARDGIDPVAALATDMDGVIEQVAAKVNATVSKIKGFQDGDEPDEETSGRTRMVDGRSPRTRTRGRDDDSAPDFVSQLKEAQRKMNIF